MITITKQYRLTGSTSASTVTYTWSSNTSCATVDKVTGTVASGTVVEFTFTFDNEPCLSTTFTLSVFDDVCPTPVEYEYTYSNPCSSLDVTVSNTPDRGNPFVFTSSAIGGTAPYTYEWVYNTSLFDLQRQVGSTLALSLKDDVQQVPGNTTIFSRVIDANGCTEVEVFSYAICQPIATNVSTESICVTPITVNNKSYNSWAGGIQLGTSECSGTQPDWSTVELDYDTSSLFVQTNLFVMTVYANSTTTSQTYTINYTVRNTYGVQSTTGTVTVIVPPCSVAELNQGPSIPAAFNTKFPSGATSGDQVTLELTDKIFAQ